MRKLIFPSVMNGMCMIKPTFTEKEDDIEKKLKSNGWNVVNRFKKRLDLNDVKKLYKKHTNASFFLPLLGYMTSDDVVVYGLHKDTKDPIKDMKNLKGEIRTEYGNGDAMKNVVHTPDSLSNMEYEYGVLSSANPVAESNEDGDKVVYTRNKQYDEFMERIKMLPENVAKKAIELYMETSNQGQDEVDIEALINQITKMKNVSEKKMKTFSSIISESGADYVSNYIDKELLIQMLKGAFAEEVNAWYQYIVCAPFLFGKERKEIEEKFIENAKDELEDHAQWLLERINQLGGDMTGIDDLQALNNLAVHKFIKPSMTNRVLDALNKNIEAEKGAIETYVAIELFTRDKDVVTNKKIKEILSDEEEHLQALEEFLEDVGDGNTLPTIKY